MDASTCRSCGAAILWVQMASGRRMPLDAKAEVRIVLPGGEYEGAKMMDTYVSHFATCPQAAQHRKKPGS